MVEINTSTKNVDKQNSFVDEIVTSSTEDDDVVYENSNNVKTRISKIDTAPRTPKS